MYNVSNVYKSVINGYSRCFTARLKKAGQLLDARVKNYTIQKSSSTGDDFCIGCAFASTVTIDCATNVDIKDQEIALETGLYTGENNIEYIPDGIYKITSVKEKDGGITATGYDRMYTKGGVICKIPSILPITLANAAAFVAEQLGTTFDTACLSGISGINIDKWPESVAVSVIVGYLAGLIGRNAYITRDGKLTFQGYTESEYTFDRDRVSDSDIDFSPRTVNWVRCVAGDDTLNSGTGTGYIKTENPLMTQAQLDTISGQIKGFNYYGATAPILLGDSRLDPWDIIHFRKNGQDILTDETGEQLTDENGEVLTDIAEEEIPLLCHEIVLSYDGGLQMDITSYALSESEENLENRSKTEIELEKLKKKLEEAAITARLVSITADSYVFKYDASGNLTGLGQVTLTAEAQNVDTAGWQFLNSDGTWMDYPALEEGSELSGPTLIVKPTHAVFFNDTAKIKALTTDSAIYDTVTISKLRDGGAGSAGQGGLSVILGNEAQTIACSADGLVAEKTTVSIPFAGYIGTTQAACSCSLGSLPSGVTTQKNQAATASADGEIILIFPIGSNLGGTANGTIDLTFTISGRKIIKKFSWSKSNEGQQGDKGDKGDPGERGLQGLQGIDGKQGIPGPAGADGKTSYFHIKYSANANGNPMSETPNTYIGTYVDYTEADSTDYTKYKWSRFEGVQGEKGDRGIPGTNGDDGKTSYLHIAYANSADGRTGFSVSDSTNKSYIGQYTDFIQADSTDPSKYSWTLIKGADGKDGTTYYTWIKYADTPTTGMSDNPEGKAYMGIAYNKPTQNESTNYSDYTWSKTEGKQGVPGEPGDDGKTTYTWIKYANDALGNGISDNPEGKDYIGMAYNKTTATESTNAADYTWSKFRGDDGVPGRTYWLESSVELIKKGANNVLSPSSLTFTAYYRDGDSATRTAYAGRLKISESTTTISSWTTKYTSTANQSSRTHTPSSSGVKYIRCQLYAAGGTTTELASMTISVVEDSEGAVDEIDKMLTQKEIFNRLTNNGQAQGFYFDETTGDLYINASYIVSGILASLNGEHYINLETGEISFANGAFTFTAADGLKITGTLTAEGKITIKKVGGSTTSSIYYESGMKVIPGAVTYKPGGTTTSFYAQSNTTWLRIEAPMLDVAEIIVTSLYADEIIAKTKISSKRADFLEMGARKVMCDELEVYAPWTALTLKTGFIQFDFERTKLSYRKIGNHVYISGSVKLSGAFTGSAMDVAALPTDIWPLQNAYKLAACGGARIARIIALPRGVLSLEWIRNLLDGTVDKTTTGLWVSMTMDYWTD